MSGGEYASFTSDMYRLTLSGGISSWDYDSVRENSQRLEQALVVLKSELDDVFKEEVGHLNLPVVDYQSIDPHPPYIDGVLIESDPEKELEKSSHFLSYFDQEKAQAACADDECFIPDTSFKITIDFLVKERVKRSDVQSLLQKMIVCLRSDTALMARLY